MKKTFQKLTKNKETESKTTDLQCSFDKKSNTLIVTPEFIKSCFYYQSNGQTLPIKIQVDKFSDIAKRNIKVEEKPKLNYGFITANVNDIADGKKLAPKDVINACKAFKKYQEKEKATSTPTITFSGDFRELFGSEKLDVSLRCINLGEATLDKSQIVTAFRAGATLNHEQQNIASVEVQKIINTRNRSGTIDTTKVPVNLNNQPNHNVVSPVQPQYSSSSSSPVMGQQPYANPYNTVVHVPQPQQQYQQPPQQFIQQQTLQPVFNQSPQYYGQYPQPNIYGQNLQPQQFYQSIVYPAQQYPDVVAQTLAVQQLYEVYDPATNPFANAANAANSASTQSSPQSTVITNNPIIKQEEKKVELPQESEAVQELRFALNQLMVFQDSTKECLINAFGGEYEGEYQVTLKGASVQQIPWLLELVPSVQLFGDPSTLSIATKADLLIDGEAADELREKATDVFSNAKKEIRSQQKPLGTQKYTGDPNIQKRGWGNYL